jgi:hypothetical protein
MNRKDFRPNDDKNDFSSTKNNAHYKNGLLHEEKSDFKYDGYAIGRQLYENNDDGKTASKKDFTYFPEKVHGKPPYFYKNKKDAIKHFKKLKLKNKFPANQENSKIIKVTKKTYLDRY